MWSTDYTLRSGHLLLLLLVGSSVILGYSYLNEMYERIHLQADVTAVQKQTQHVVSEKLELQHKASKLEIKLEALTHDMKRLQDIHEFRAQQQTVNFEKQKNELLENISLKDEAIKDLKERYENLKVRFDSLHSLMEQFQNNQSRLLEKFTTQSTQCMNVISMMTALCNNGRDKFRKILPFIKENNNVLKAVKNQPLPSFKKAENNYMVPEEASPNTENSSIVRYFMQTITPKLVSQSGGKQRILTGLEPEVNDLEQEKTVKLENIQHKESASDIINQWLYQNVAEHNVTSPDEELKFKPQDVSFQDEEDYVISEKDLNETFQFKKVTNHIQRVDTEKSTQNIPHYSSVDSNKSLQVMEKNTRSFKNVDGSKGNSLHLTTASNTTINKDIASAIEKELEEKLNDNLLEEKKDSKNMTKKHDIEVKDKEESLKMKIKNALSSHNDVHSTKNDKHRNSKENKNLILPATEKENDGQKL